MRWAPPIFAAAVCFGLGVVSSPMPQRAAATSHPAGEPAVLSWLASRGLHPVASLRLDPTSNQSVWLVTDGASCEAAVAPLDGGAAIAILRNQVATEAWDSARLWAGTLQGWSDSPLVLSWRRFVRWTKGGAAPEQALLAGPARCLDALASNPPASPG